MDHLFFTDEQYFARHRELAAVHGVHTAWQMVEAELPKGFRRYSCFNSFENAKSRFSKGVRMEAVWYKYEAVTK